MLQLEIKGQVRDFIYRGVGVNLRLNHTSEDGRRTEDGALAGGRILVVRKTDFDNWGGACQDMGLVKKKKRRLDDDAAEARPSWDRAAGAADAEAGAIRGKRLSNATCLSQVFFKSGESFDKLR